ncbi:MAG: DUF2304 domain-containing protein [Armatimonadetes bacterium]|nr:DUF2304 domain-containing protein [Armatimonadota bacterium]
MNLHSKFVVSLFVVALFLWVLRLFTRKQLNSGQASLWLITLVGCEVLALSPSLADSLSVIWGNLVPVSWISFVGMVLLICCLLSQSVQLNNLQEKLTQMVRHHAFLEQRVRKLESAHTKDTTDSP